MNLVRYFENAKEGRVLGGTKEISYRDALMDLGFNQALFSAGDSLDRRTTEERLASKGIFGKLNLSIIERNPTKQGYLHEDNYSGICGYSALNLLLKKFPFHSTPTVRSDIFHGIWSPERKHYLDVLGGRNNGEYLTEVHLDYMVDESRIR